jgi:hypothetical protein
MRTTGERLAPLVLAALLVRVGPAGGQQDVATGAGSGARRQGELPAYREVLVSSDEGFGAGFLVDTLGIVLTRDRVVGYSRHIRVLLDDTTRVEAALLAADPSNDIAAIRIDADAAHLDRATIPARSANPARVLGAPPDAEANVLRIAVANARLASPPPARRLPLPARVSFPVASTEDASRGEDFDPSGPTYAVSEVIETGPFDVSVQTPPSLGRWQRIGMSVAGQSAEIMGHWPRELPTWTLARDFGYVPVVTLLVRQDSAAAVARPAGDSAPGLGPPPGDRTYVRTHRGHVDSMALFRDREPIEELARTLVAAPRGLFRKEPAGLQDEPAECTLWQCSPWAFRPVKRRPPRIRVVLTADADPGRPIAFDLPPETVKRVWQDFASWRRLTGTLDPALEYPPPKPKRVRERGGWSLTKD